MTNLQPSEDNMKDRINNLFSGQEPPSYASLSEFERMKTRIKELEAELVGRSKSDNEASKPVAGTKAESVPSKSRDKEAQVQTAKRSWLPAILTAPVFERDEEKNRSAKLLHQIVMASWLLPLVAVIVNIINPSVGQFALPAAGVMAIALTIIMFLNRAGRVRAGSYLIVGMLYVVLVYLNYSGAGEPRPILLLSVISIMISGLMLGGRGAIVTAVLLAAQHSIILWFNARGLIVPLSDPATPLQNALVSGVSYLLIGFMLQLAIARIQFVVNQLREEEVELEFKNRELQELSKSLEERVADRTHDLELASEVGRTVAARVDNLNTMLNEAVELIRARFNLYYTQVYLTDPSGYIIILRAGTGEVGRQLVQHGHNLVIGRGSLNGRSASEKQAVIVADTLNSESFLPNPLLPNTRSEMAVPLLVGDRVVGVLDMQSEQPNALNETNLPAFEALAGQLAVAVQNASLFEQANQARSEVEHQAKRQSYADWVNFLNAVERSEKIGYIYNQNEVIPYVNISENLNELNSLHAPISVAGVEIGKIHIVDAPERKWTATEADIIHNTATQLSRHIENLRLLAQSEKYRLEAEQASRRLTREGWQDFLKVREGLSEGFIYDQNKVASITNTSGPENDFHVRQPLMIRDEVVGELETGLSAGMTREESEAVLQQIASNLSAHIENLRLLEETEISRAEVEKSQEQYSLAVSGSNDGIWDWDIVKDQIYYSARWKGMLGYEEHELTRGFVEWEELIHPEDRDYAVKALEDYLEQRATEYAVELRLRHKDGSWRWIRDRGKALRREDGTPYRMAGSHSDITERKLNEELIAQRANQLETVATVSTTTSTVLNPDELLQTVVDLTKERFGLYHTHIYLADESWNTLLLAAGAGNVGRSMVATGHAIETDTVRSLVARAYRERNAIIVNDIREDEGFLPNPLLPNTRAEMAVPMIVGEKVIGVFDMQSETAGSFTEEDALIYNTLASQVAIALQNARLYQEQAATVTQLRELDRLKSSFLANMSHELRTPLNSILGFADVMIEGLDGPLTDYMNNDLRLIQKNGQHLLHLINDVLDMAKIESGRMNLHPETFRVHEIMEEVTSITSTLANDRNLALYIEPDSNQDVQISADRTRLRQVMINLVNNAIKFTEKGNVSIQVEKTDEENILICVRDTGLGIPPEQLDDIFNEFTQVDTTTTRKAGGTGLGLPISRRLVQMHGGELWADSSGIEGHGSTFYVRLPIEAHIAEVEKQEKK